MKQTRAQERLSSSEIGGSTVLMENSALDARADSLWRTQHFIMEQTAAQGGPEHLKQDMPNAG